MTRLPFTFMSGGSHDLLRGPHDKTLLFPNFRTPALTCAATHSLLVENHFLPCVLCKTIGHSKALLISELEQSILRIHILFELLAM